MVGPQYDFFANPLGAVRLTFEKAVAASPDFDPAAFDRKDWGAIDLFRNFLFDDDGLSQVPILDPASRNWIQPNSLVRFRGMVQDMFDNELYIGAFKDGLTWRTNKFSDVSVTPMDPASQTRLWERRLLYCAPVPGQNSWTLESSSPTQRHVLNNCTSQHGEKRLRDADIDEMDCNIPDQEERELSSSFKKQKEDETCCQSSEELIVQNGQSKPSTVKHLEANSLSCLVKIYDTPEADLKLNDVIEFIGVYTFDPDVAIQKDEPDELSFDLLGDVLAHISPSKVPRVHCVVHRKLTAQDFILSSHLAEPLPNLLRGIRESLVGHLTAVLGSDGLAAHCVLLHLLSKVRARVDVVSVGKLSLNLMGFTRESASIFGNQLTLLTKSMLPFSRTIPLSVEYLNTTELQPRKDNQTGRMVAGVLQLAQGTHLTIDETHLNAGTLNSTGLENVRLLKHLLEWQKVEYDFEYYKLEMPADVQMLILSEGKSNILPADLVLPFRPTVITSVSASAEQLEAWRAYLAFLRSLPLSIEPEMQKILEDDLVAAKKEDVNLRGEDFSRWLTMAQLISLSFGESSLSLEHWQMVKELERLRKERLLR